MRAMMSRGLFTRMRGEDVICLAPPIVSGEAQIDRIVEIVHDAIHEVF